MSKTPVYNTPKDPRTFIGCTFEQYSSQWEDVCADIKKQRLNGEILPLKSNYQGYQIFLRLNPTVTNYLARCALAVYQKVPIFPVPEENMALTLLERAGSEDQEQRVVTLLQELHQTQGNQAAIAIREGGLDLTFTDVTFDGPSLIAILRPTTTWFNMLRNLRLRIEPRSGYNVCVEEGKFNPVWGPYITLGYASTPSHPDPKELSMLFTNLTANLRGNKKTPTKIGPESIAAA